MIFGWCSVVRHWISVVVRSAAPTLMMSRLLRNFRATVSFVSWCSATRTCFGKMHKQVATSHNHIFVMLLLPGGTIERHGHLSKSSSSKQLADHPIAHDRLRTLAGGHRLLCDGERTDNQPPGHQIAAYVCRSAVGARTWRLVLRAVRQEQDVVVLDHQAVVDLHTCDHAQISAITLLQPAFASLKRPGAVPCALNMRWPALSQPRRVLAACSRSWNNHSGSTYSAAKTVAHYIPTIDAKRLNETIQSQRY